MTLLKLWSWNHCNNPGYGLLYWGWNMISVQCLQHQHLALGVGHVYTQHHQITPCPPPPKLLCGAMWPRLCAPDSSVPQGCHLKCLWIHGEISLATMLQTILPSTLSHDMILNWLLVIVSWVNEGFKQCYSWWSHNVLSIFRCWMSLCAKVCVTWNIFKITFPHRGNKVFFFHNETLKCSFPPFFV